MSGSISVVVSRRVDEGADDAFVQWATRIIAEAAKASGFLGAELQRPDHSHPQEWVTVYRFATAEELAAWRSSEQRAGLIDEIAPRLQGPTNEQIVAEPARTDRPVTVVTSQNVRRGRTRDFEAAHDRVVASLSTFPGFLHSEVIPPVDGVSREHVIAFAFDTRAHLDRWLESDERRSWLTQIGPLLEGDRTINVVGGFAGWFPAGEEPHTPKWKQAAAVLLALFPTALTLSVLRQMLLPDLALVPSVFLSNVLGVAILTWLLMPWLTRVLQPWLER
jgi:antibiotic biosynthesis monooxygenase (ABM) superfamily enzyme